MPCNYAIDIYSKFEIYLILQNECGLDNHSNFPSDGYYVYSCLIIILV